MISLNLGVITAVSLEAGRPKHDIARFPHMTNEERQAPN
jgi:hypothetical protein